MSSLFKYLQFKYLYNEEYEKSSNLAIFNGNFLLSLFLLIVNSFLFIYLLLMCWFESNDRFNHLFNKLIYSGFFSLIITALNWLIVNFNKYSSKFLVLKKFEKNIFKFIQNKNYSIIPNCILTIPFQIIYYLCKEYYTNYSDLIFLFMGIEYIIRYCLIIKYNFSYSFINTVSSLTTLFIHSLFFQNLSPLLTIYYSFNFIFSSIFAYTYQNYLKYQFFENSFLKNERTFLTEVIDNMKSAYLFTDKENILYRNKAFDLFYYETKEVSSLKQSKKESLDTGI